MLTLIEAIISAVNTGATSRHVTKLKTVQTEFINIALSTIPLLFKSLWPARNRETPSYRYTVEENNNTFILNLNCPFLLEENPGVNPSNRT